MQFFLRLIILVVLCSLTMTSSFAKDINLGDYQPLCDRVKLNKIKGASGITYNDDTDSFFIIINRPSHIFEIERDKILACVQSPKKFTIDYPSGNQFPLEGFSDETRDLDDTEGIAHIENGMFIVVEEERGRVAKVTLAAGSMPTDIQIIAESDYTAAYRKTHDIENKGLEGVAYDNQSGDIYVANETKPKLIKKQTKALPFMGPPSVSFKLGASPNSNDWTKYPLGRNLEDLSDLYYDGKRPNFSENLLILSHESYTAVEFSLTKGEKVSELDFSKLRKKVPQAEGITMDNEGYIYIVSEDAYTSIGPDKRSLLYIFCNKEIAHHCDITSNVVIKPTGLITRLSWKSGTIILLIFALSALITIKKRMLQKRI